METVDYSYVHACNGVPRDAKFCPHCGQPDPFAELAGVLIENLVALQILAIAQKLGAKAVQAQRG